MEISILGEGNSDEVISSAGRFETLPTRLELPEE